MLADRPGGCAQDHADLIVSFTLCDPRQHLCFARSESRDRTTRASLALPVKNARSMPVRPFRDLPVGLFGRKAKRCEFWSWREGTLTRQRSLACRLHFLLITPGTAERSFGKRFGFYQKFESIGCSSSMPVFRS